MDAAVRFHQKRMGYVKDLFHTRHNIPLDLISLNWYSKYVSVKGQIVVKTCQSGSLKYIKYQDIEPEVEDQAKTTSGRKDSRGKNPEQRNPESEKAKSKDTTFIVQQKNMRQIHSSKRIEEMVCELEGYRWDAILMSETWRPEKSEICERHKKHFFMGAGKYDKKHGVGIMLNKKWRQKIIDTEYISERAITTTIVVYHQRINLMSVYFTHSGYAVHHVESMYRTIEKHTTNDRNCIPIIGGHFNAELGP